MTLDSDSCYRALVARDPRFDGVFFVGVRTTGIYCRPVCTARTPRRERCSFFVSAAAAERAGFRACFRCRPELAPGRASIDAVPRLVDRAAAMIDDGFLDERSVEALAAELGVSSRHLRRAMESELGVTPLEIAQSRRLAIAKQLLADTSLPLTAIAYASGFRSLRRFNAAFRARFARAPSAARRARSGRAGPETEIALSLAYRPPLDWQELLAFFRARAIAGVEAVGEREYTRTVRFGEHAGTVRVTHALGGRTALVARVSPSLVGHLLEVTAALRALFDLDAQPQVIDAHLSRDARLRPLVARRPGVRVPGTVDPFETMVRALLGQQISVRAAATLGGRFAERFGAVTQAGERVFPAPAAVASARADDVARIGVPRARAEALVRIARAFDERPDALHRRQPAAEARAWLLSLPCVGPWTAEYVAMRALGWPDAFPASDLGVRKALGGVTAERAEHVSEAWRPWRAYAVLHLWRSLSEKGGSR